jgi:YD repeat-containing protein
MKINLSRILLLLLLISSNKIIAQTSQPSLQTPTITPPSLSAQAFMRYGEIPVDYSTGVPNISIPLYTIKGKELELPISISYHGSGIKVNDIASEVGLGWILNCGGMVARTIFGKKDESVSGIHTYTTAQQIFDAIEEALGHIDITGYSSQLFDFNEYLKNTYEQQDPQSDRFFYSLPNGISGVFRYDWLTKELIKLPNRPLKIERELYGDVLSKNILRIKITDENGSEYTFEPYLANLEFITNSSDYYLTRILSSDGTDSIKFTYDVASSQSGVFSYSHTFIGPIKHSGNSDCADSGNPQAWDPFCRHSSSGGYYFEGPKIKKITTPLATVDFTYNNNVLRTDFSYMHQLNKITIKSNISDSTLKTIDFSQEYFGSGNNSRMKLQSVIISSPVNNNPEVYSFQYESQTLPDYPQKAGADARFEEDYWGYYNNSNSKSLVPGDFVPTEYNSYTNYYGNRNPDTTVSKACMIKQIKYPTGGKTVFKFERNYAKDVYDFRQSNRDGFAGGYRVQTILNYNENNQLVSTKTYEYGNAIARPITLENFTQNMEYFYNNTRLVSCGDNFYCWVYCYLNYSRYMISSNPFLPLEVGVGLPVVYTSVVEYNGTKTNNVGKTIYRYNSPFSPNNIYDNLDHVDPDFESSKYIHPFNWDKGNYVPELKSQSEYSFDGQNYHLVSKTTNTYSKYLPKEFSTGLNLTQLKDYPSKDLTNTKVNIQEYPSKIAVVDTKAYQEATLLTKTENYTYNPSDSTKFVLTTTDLEYEENYLQLRKKTVSTSIANKNLITEYKYPFDNSSLPPYTSMKAKHIVTPIIEQTEKTNTTTLQTITTKYKDWFGDQKIIAPDTVIITKGSSTSKTRFIYKYDKLGNISEASKGNDVKTAYLWGYKGSYPVAKIEGKAEADISIAIKDTIANHKYLGKTDNTNISADINSLNTTLASLFADKTCRVTFYTYAPLIGMTSQTDSNGITTYYEYDTFGRLKCVRDDNKKILKTFNYHYRE